MHIPRPNRITACIVLAVFSFLACKKSEEKLIADELVTHRIQGHIGAPGVSTIFSKDHHLFICGTNDLMALVLKTDDEGDDVWRNSLAAGIMNKAEAIVETPAGDVYISGTDLTPSGHDPVIVKLKANGDSLWSKKYQLGRSIENLTLLYTRENSLILTGMTHLFDDIKAYDLVLMKVQLDGTLEWSKVIETAFNEFSSGAIQLSDGTFLATSTRSVDGTDFRIHLLSFDQHGNILWEKEIGPSNRRASSTIQDNDGNLVICGHTDVYGLYDSNLLLAKTDSQGNVLWQREYGESQYSEAGFALAQDPDGNYVVAGAVHEGLLIDNGSKVMMLKVDINGGTEWCKYYVGSGYNGGANVLIDDDLIYVTGYENGWIFFAKMDEHGVVVY